MPNLSDDSDLVASWQHLDLNRLSARDLAHPAVDAVGYEQDAEAKGPMFTHLSLLPVPYLGICSEPTEGFRPSNR